MDRTSFGRRGGAQPVRPRTIPVAHSKRPVSAGIPVDMNLTPTDAGPSVEEELRVWKRQRSFRIPWKQVCLMATICFGVASFVLPASVNSAVDWLLYGLTGMSFYAWFTARRTRPNS